MTWRLYNVLVKFLPISLIYLSRLLSQREAGTCSNLSISSTSSCRAPPGPWIVWALRSSRQNPLPSGSLYSRGVPLHSHSCSFLCFLAVVELLVGREGVSVFLCLRGDSEPFQTLVSFGCVWGKLVPTTCSAARKGHLGGNPDLYVHPWAEHRTPLSPSWGLITLTLSPALGFRCPVLKAPSLSQHRLGLHFCRPPQTFLHLVPQVLSQNNCLLELLVGCRLLFLVMPFSSGHCLHNFSATSHIWHTSESWWIFVRWIRLLCKMIWGVCGKHFIL